MQFQRPGLGRRDKRLDPVELEVGLAVAPDLDLGDQRRLALAAVPLEEVLLAVDAVRHADHRAGPALDMVDHPRADGFIVLRQIELGDGRAVLGVGPQAACRHERW